MPIATPQGTLDFKSVDKVTFVGASSNTVIDTTTGSLGVGVDGNGPTSKLHVVGNAFISSDLTVSGDATFSGTGALTVPAGATGDRPATDTNGMIRYNSTTGFMEGYAAAGWAPIAQPPTVTGISPLSTLASGGIVAGWNEKQSIIFGTASAGDQFGAVVAISSDGNYGAAAALGDAGGGTDSGTVTMYKRNTATDQWSQLQTENIPSGAANYDRFGSTISLSSDGQALTIGCQLADRGGQTAAGMVSTWRFNGSTYSQVGEITNPRGNTAWAEWSAGETEKGMYMSGNGLNMIVGTKLYNSSRGIVDLYSRSAITDNWTFYGTIQPSIHTHATLYFGASVAMSSDGKVVVVGAYLAQNTVYQEGAAYVYEYTGSADGVYSGGSWVHRSTLLSTTPKSSGQFGQRVEISGDANYVLIGDSNKDSAIGGTSCGGAQVYVRSGNAWNFQQSLVDPDASQSDHMGKSISINSDGTHILVGAPNDDGPTGGAVIDSAGKVLHFKRTDTTWAYSDTIYAPTPTANDNFGADSSTSISGDGTRALLGVKSDDTPYTDNGQLIYYKFAPETVIDSSTQVFTATGTGIVSGSTVQLEGADGSLYSVVDATPNTAGTQVTFKMQAGGGSTGTVYPDIDMTSASQGGYVVTAHTEGVGSEAMWKAFDGDSSSTFWKVDNGYSTSSPYSAVAISGVLPSFTDTAGTPHAGHWIQLELPNKIKLTRFVTAANFASSYFMKSYVVLGSNDNTSWTLLHSEANGTGVQDVTTLSGGSTSFFKYFKLLVKSKLDVGAHLQVGEVEFYGILDDGRFDVAQQPYKVRINSTSGLIGASTAVIGFPPTWTTAVGTNLSFDIGGSATQTLVGTDGAGGTNRTFSLAPGSNALPAKVGGGTLGLDGSTGEITGQIAAAGNTSVTFRLTDNGSGLFTDRAINIVGSSALYTFTSHTFTPAGATGRGGPTLTEARNAYSISVPPSPATPWDEDTNLFNILSTEKGIQRWTVPKTGSYTIDAYGARGAFNNGTGATPGKGARIKGTFNLTKDQVIKIAVGQEGWIGSGANRSQPGGGGGTFVWIDDPPNNPLIVAGGGGGARLSATTDADGQSGTSAGIATTNGFTAERGYPGQVVGVGHGSWINGSGYACAGGGAGWLSEGHDTAGSYTSAYAGTNGSYWKQSTSQCCHIGTFGRDLRLASGMRVSNFALTGSGQNYSNPADGILVNTVNEKLYGGFQGCNGSETNSVGGFGGGGGGGGSGEGGGGGYTGGAGTYSGHVHGGGGGSYNGGSSQTNTAGSMNGNGSCTITFVS